MIMIPDDPIVRCIERTGYPPWMKSYSSHWDDYKEDDEDFGESDVFYGNESEGW